MVAWSVHAHICTFAFDLYAIRTAPIYCIPKRPSRVPGPMLQESEKDRRGKETDRTHGIEFTLASSHRQYNDHFGLFSMANALPLTIEHFAVGFSLTP
jgi:hypothetical protein